MGAEVRGFKGIVQRGNPLAMAPGALSDAVNVEIDGDGMIGSRPGLHSSQTGIGDVGKVLSCTPNGSGAIVVGSAAVVEADGETTTVVEGITPSTGSYVEVGDLGFLTTTQGVMARVDGVFERPSIPSGLGVFLGGFASQAYVTGSKGWLEANNRVAYRAVIERYTESGRLFYRSAPSARLVLKNTLAEKVGIKLRISFNHTIVASERYRVVLYRSFQTPSTVPSDEMFEVASIPLTDGAKSVQYEDFSPDAALGEAIYTSPFLGGAESANTEIPAADLLTTYQDSLFAFGVRGDWFIDVEWTALSEFTPDFSTIQAGHVGGVHATGTVTAGSPIINVANTIGIAVGALLRNTSNIIREERKSEQIVVTSIAGTKVTMSAPMDFSGTFTVFFDAAFRLNDLYLPFFSPSSFYTAGNDMDDSIPELPEGGRVRVTPLDPYGQLRKADASIVDFGADPLPARVRYRISVPGHFFDEPPEIWFSQGSELSPKLQNTFNGPGTKLRRDAWPALAAYSKRFQPTHFVNGAQQFTVGDPSHGYVAGVVASNVLYAMKTDGVFTIVGAGAASGFRVDPYDASLIAISPQHVCEVNGQVAAWTTRGVVLFGAGGARNLSEFKIDPDLLGYRTGADVAGNLSHDKERDELVFVLNDGAKKRTWRYSLAGDSWVRVDAADPIVLACLVPTGLAGGSHFGYLSESGRFRYRGSFGDWRDATDGRPAGVTVTTTLQTGVVNLVFGAARAPSAGDVLVVGDAIALITEVIASSSAGARVRIENATGQVTSGAGQLWYGYTCGVYVHDIADAVAGAWKRWQRVTWNFWTGLRLRAATLGVDSSRSTAVQTVKKLASRYSLLAADTAAGDTLTMHVGPGHAHSAMLRPSLETREAGQSWTVLSATLESNVVSTKVRQ